MLDFGELETSIDEMIKELQAANSTIDSYETIIADDSETIHEQREQLAAQRRTIATLRARLRNRSVDGEFFAKPGIAWRNLSTDIYAPEKRWLYRARVLLAHRIAAIRNFGVLP